MHYRPSIQQTPLKLPRQLFYQFSGKGDEIVEKYVKQLEVSVKRYQRACYEIVQHNGKKKNFLKFSLLLL